ncbi:hypothetical protein JX266_014274 [Neoarthrinium moseri]|nr:hypothetical protein JX266_014274 [Neoarthrinium moseri]
MEEAIKSLITADEHVWESKEHCRTTWRTKGGGNEHILSYDKDEEAASIDSQQNIGWNNPASTAPPRFFFESPGIGQYSVQFTVTDTVAWSGTPNTKKCYVEGLFNPQYVFYHDGYNIILNTWQSQGIESDCYYLSNCQGLCTLGVYSQGANGDSVGGSCAIPCKDEGAGSLPSVPKQQAKIMVAGDSISHGMQDDWTWRWRLKSWLDLNGYVNQFVGPYVGTHGRFPIEVSQPSAPLFPNEAATDYSTRGGYAPGVTGDFVNWGHASWWGRKASESMIQVNTWVSNYQPDYLLVLPGFNDLGWFGSDAYGLIGNIGALVENAREAKPDIKILVGNVVDWSFINGRQDLIDSTKLYNQLLRDTIPSWVRLESPIAYVDVNANYDCRPEGCRDGYDGLHPTALGEWHIAQAFASVLKKSFGFDGSDLIVPNDVDSRPVSTPGNVRVESHPEGLLARWDGVPNARGYEIRERLAGMTDWWSSGIVYPDTVGSWQTWATNGQTWEFSVRTKGDQDVRSDWSNVLSGTAQVQTAPGPSIINVQPTADGMEVSWVAVTGYDVNRYSVIVWDRDVDGSFAGSYPAAGVSLTIGGLVPGHRYSVWVETHVNMIGSLTGKPAMPGGVPAQARDVRVGGGSPAQPTGLHVTSIDSGSIQLDWSAAAGAVGYAVYVRSILDNTAFTLSTTTTATTQGEGFLFPGAWHFEFCVTAFNGNYETPRTSACITSPVCCGFTKRDDPVVGSPPNTVNSSANSAPNIIEVGSLYSAYSRSSRDTMSPDLV